jgi:hypothetical protein
MNTRLAILFAWLVFLSHAQAITATTRPPVSYGRDIRPILSDKCYRCHGPDGKSRQAELRLDTREGLATKVVIAGKPEKSELVTRIFSDDDDERMPPPDSKLTLTPEQKDLLRRWISEGATFTEHWAFQPLPDKVAIPKVNDESWPRQPIDRFILARLDAEKLRPTNQADALRLLRRATLDLTGLPPSADDCRQFDKAAAKKDLDTAYEQAVDKLLASSAYGEHMAVSWLDAARYADSYGYQSDQLNSQWPYRDWVVRALNANMPYDQFLTCQLAGDLIDHPTRDQILATAFNRLHRLTGEGGSIAEEWMVENASDRIHTFGTAILGLTVECCRCHDHKYDPISMRDYYSLSAFFNSIDENGLYDHPAKVPSPSLLLPTEQQEKQLITTRQEVANAHSALTKTIQEGNKRFEHWLASLPTAAEADLSAYFTFDGSLTRFRNEAPGGKGEFKAARLRSVEGAHERAVRFDGDHGADLPNIFQVDRWTDFGLDFWMRDTVRNPKPVVVLQRTFGTDVGYNGFDLMLEDGILTARLYRVWPGNAIGVRSRSAITQNEWQHIAVTYDGSSTAAGLRIFLNGQPLASDTLRDRIQKKASLPTYGAGHLTLGQRFRDRGFKDGDLDELRIYDRALTSVEIANRHDGKAFAAALADPKTHRDELEAYYFSAVDIDARKAKQKLRDARQHFIDAEEPIQEVPVMDDMPAPRPTFILARGRYDAPKNEANRVGRDTFAKLLMPFPKDAPRNRLGLARWLTDPRHPLTARVFVNRMWVRFFGRGLVTTPENFGQQGALPTHPELLDWLSRDFIEHGWDTKRLCRMIVLSATYRQDSRCASELRERDPENQMLARGPSRRLSAEQIRDVALAASGLLDRKMGGPPVSPYQPGGDLWREANTMSPAYQQSTGRDLYRRSLYSVWKRTTPLPNMATFDAPSREVCTVSRGRTNTPLQALVLLNDVQFVEAARALAANVSQSNSQLPGQIDEAFLRLTGQYPDSTERNLLTDLYNEQATLFADTSQQNPTAFTKLGESTLDPKLNSAHIAALTVVCQTILNLDATIFER